MLSRLFVWIQYLLPRHWLTSFVYRVARIRIVPIKNALISGFMRLYKIDTEEVASDIPGGFRDFNEFFIRELKDGARTIDDDLEILVSPVDGTVSQAGDLNDNRILQAKGLDYTIEELLSADLVRAVDYAGGSFATIYLAPYNYHRVHAPLGGELVAAHYVPGDLYSVNDATAARVPGLFRRNERLNLHFSTPYGPMLLVLVGALHVGSISTPWSGEIRPRKSGVVESFDLSSHPEKLAKGDLVGWFNMGSTVILLMPPNACQWCDGIESGQSLKMGQAIGRLGNLQL